MRLGCFLQRDYGLCQGESSVFLGCGGYGNSGHSPLLPLSSGLCLPEGVCVFLCGQGMGVAGLCHKVWRHGGRQVKGVMVRIFGCQLGLKKKWGKGCCLWLVKERREEEEEEEEGKREKKRRLG